MEHFAYLTEEAKELAARWEDACDPSVRDVLVRLDEIEVKIDALLAPKRQVASDGSWVETPTT